MFDTQEQINQVNSPMAGIRTNLKFNGCYSDYEEWRTSEKGCRYHPADIFYIIYKSSSYKETSFFHLILICEQS